MYRRSVLAIFALLLCAVAVKGATFTVLPDMGSLFKQSYVQIMNDGSFVGFGGGAVSRWTLDGGYTQIAQVPTSLYSTPLQATDISADGNAIIGVATNADNTWPSSAVAGFRWTAATGFESMPGFAGTTSLGVPTAMSSDGSVIVGMVKIYDGFFQQSLVPFRWTAATGTQTFDVPGEPSSVSNDGVVVGTRLIGEYRGEAYRWTAATGAVDLGFLSNDWESSNAELVSADGQTVVGSAWTDDSDSGFKTFRWTADGGMQQLTSLGTENYVFGLSSNGQIIVGTSKTVGPGFSYSYSEPYIWTPGNGDQLLYDVLAASGAADESWLNQRDKSHWAFQVSPNGRFVFGMSQWVTSSGFGFANYASRGWLIDLGEVPEPAGVVVAVVGIWLAGLARCRRGRSWERELVC